MKSVATGLVAFVGLVIASGCKTPKPAPAPRDSRPVEPEAVRLQYVDSEAFDLLLETTLLNAHPVIVVQTDHDKPDWGPRLNAWIAAWNSGGRVRGPRVRGQIPTVPGVVVDGDSIREFRLLIDGLMSRVEESARLGAYWWAEKHMRDRRVALLRPYNLRFHLGADERIQLIFFHGDYAALYGAVTRSLTHPDHDECLEWSHGYCCSLSKGPAKKEPGTD
jgi:hypothetical protein